jgi:hypothetical protein
MAKKPVVKSHMGSRYNRASQSGQRQALQKSFQAGMADILGNLGDFIADVKDFVPEVGIEALEETLGKAIEYTPVKDGTLRDSAYLEAETHRGGVVIAIGFGRGGRPDYAVYVHELPYQHEAPTRSKFLEAALDEDYYQILNKIPRLIRERAGT